MTDNFPLALAVMALSTAASSLMTQPWHYVATWGVISGVGSGAVAMVLGATVVNRWFVERRGLMMGLLSASAATGSLIFLPGMAAVAEAGGWRPVVLAVAAVMAVLFLCLTRSAPYRRGLAKVTAALNAPPPAAGPDAAPAEKPSAG